MKEPELLAEGKFSPEDLVVSVSKSNRKIDHRLEAQIDGLWETKRVQAEREGRVCYNGISCRLDTFELESRKIRISFGPLEFKVREILPTIPGYYDLPHDYWRKGCFSAATVRTADGQYLVVELSGKSMNSNAVDVLGGIMEKPIEICTGEDVFECLYAELEEEGRIQQADIMECYLRAVFLSHRTNVCFYYEVNLNISSDVLLARFKHEERDQDIKALIALSREGYLAFLGSSSPDKQLMAHLSFS